MISVEFPLLENVCYYKIKSSSDSVSTSIQNPGESNGGLASLLLPMIMTDSLSFPLRANTLKQ